MRIASLESRVQSAVDTLWPVNSVKVKFFPTEDLNYGDVYSECLLDLSKSTRRAPAELGSDILEHLSSDKFKNGKISVLHDFLNFRGEDTYDWLTTIESGDLPLACPGILLPNLGSNFSPFARMRFAVVALFQVALLLRYVESVTVIADSATFEVTKCNFDEVFLTLIETLTENHSQTPLEKLSERVSKLNLKDLFVWLPTTTFSRASFSKFIRAMKGTEISVINPPRGWYQQNGEVLTGWDVERWREQLISKERSIEASMWYLCSPAVASDLDSVVIGLNESSNLWWFSRYIRGRIERFLSSLEDCKVDGTGRLKLSSSLERDLLIRLKFIDWLGSRAAFSGKVFGYVSAVQGLLSMTNRFWNNPAMRLALSRGEIEPHQRLISSGVYGALGII